MFLGRVVRPGVDPEWTRSDRLFALGWEAEQAELCRDCGQPWRETSDPEAFEDYEASLVTCWSCAERDSFRDQLGRDDSVVMPGRKIVVRRRVDA